MCFCPTAEIATGDPHPQGKSTMRQARMPALRSPGNVQFIRRARILARRRGVGQAYMLAAVNAKCRFPRGRGHIGSLFESAGIGSLSEGAVSPQG